MMGYANAVNATPPDPNYHKQVTEELLDFFEDVGTLLANGFMDNKLTESTLSFRRDLSAIAIKKGRCFHSLANWRASS